MEIEKRSNDTSLIKSIYTDVMKDTINKDIKNMGKALLKKMAEDVRKWRIEDEYSWRSVAQAFVEKYKEFSEKHNLISGNQISGIILCDGAQIKLKESWQW